MSDRSSTSLAGRPLIYRSRHVGSSPHLVCASQYREEASAAGRVMGLIHGAHFVRDPPAVTGTASVCAVFTRSPAFAGDDRGREPAPDMIGGGRGSSKLARIGHDPGNEALP